MWSQFLFSTTCIKKKDIKNVGEWDARFKFGSMITNNLQWSSTEKWLDEEEEDKKSKEERQLQIVKGVTDLWNTIVPKSIKACGGQRQKDVWTEGTSVLYL